MDLDDSWPRSPPGEAIRCLLTSLDDARRRRLRDRVHERLGRADGPFTLTARAWWARGEVRDG
jgi:hypothetical protein